jgi:protocatechuate 3,4-dioxygenase beta subunit
MFAGSGLCLRRSLLPAAAILASVFATGLSAASVSGVVNTRENGRAIPVFRAVVMARETAGSDIVAVARTDRQGRFLIVGLTSPRVVLSVQKPGYNTRSVNSRQGESVALDCSAPEDCGGVEFELARAAVVAGMVVDELGEPVSGVAVSASAVQQEDSPIEGARFTAGGDTDDRGYFRIAGLKPGLYVLKAEGRRGRFLREMRLQGDPVEVEVEEGREVAGVQITVQAAERPESFTVSGRVAGLDLTADGVRGGAGFGMVRALARGLGSPGSRVFVFARVDKDGSFTFRNVRPGLYGVAYSRRQNSSGFGESDSTPLGTMQVSGDMAGLLLRPVPPTGLSGNVKFETQQTPRQVFLHLFPEGQADSFAFSLVSGPDFDFRVISLPAGRYDLTISGRGADSALFAKGIRKGNELLPTRGFVVRDSVVENIEIVVSDDLARVYGRVKAANSDAGGGIREGAQFQVGLWGPNRRTQVTQADQYGRFHFDGVVPGDYRICAWSDLDARSVYDDKAWENAGSAVREFPVEAGSEVEIDLTAVP